MRLLTTIVTTLVCSQLFAFQPLSEKGSATFSGTGTYKTTCGEKGSYTSTLVFDGHTMSATVTVKEKAFSYKLTAEKMENGFFKITDGKKDCTKGDCKVIGGGYCFEHLCHYGVHGEGMGVEETFYYGDDQLHVLGSKWMKASSKGECGAVAWKSVLDKE